jgi:hypothetical protein
MDMRRKLLQVGAEHPDTLVELSDVSKCINRF